mmetsp:Transcript_47611/g.113142  ORF Transcript_47611/g.113142 Transcript_47611/m.113142 type:complete len:288 (-) Transcript_47611:867-1730(-)
MEKNLRSLLAKAGTTEMMKMLLHDRRLGDGHHLHEVGRTRALLLLTVDGDNPVTRSHHAVGLGPHKGLGNHCISAHERGGEHWGDSPNAEQLPHTSLAGGDGENGGLGAVLGDEAGSLASLRESDDELAAGVNRHLHRRGADALDCFHGLAHAHDAHAHREVHAAVVEHCLSLLADAAHDLHRLARELSSGGLTAEHHAVRAVEHSVGDIPGFCAGWAWGGSHGLEHLGGSDHRLALKIALLDHHLLHQEDLLGRDLHAHVTSSHHDAIAGLDDLINVLDACLILNL